MLCHLIGLAQLHLSRLSPGGGARWALYRITRLAESLVRRWLVLSAYQDGAWPEPRRAGAAGGGSGSGPEFGPEFGSVAQAPGPVFRLAERLPALAAWMFEPAPDPQSLPVREDTPFNPERLRARIAALSAVMAAPERHVRRMARWLARAAAQRARGAGRRLPLGVGWPAGTSRAAKTRDPEWVSMVLYLDQLVHEAVVRCGSP